jgi:hypothetical protein
MNIFFILELFKFSNIKIIRNGNNRRECSAPPPPPPPPSYFSFCFVFLRACDHREEHKKFMIWLGTVRFGSTGGASLSLSLSLHLLVYFRLVPIS